ncbi:Hexosyltransferase [Fasciola hepatica]|uniref:Hexosyltransferase n=1 Tax=Fasciola hepatica TaxID=6192 RepID=A0A2H1CJ15_FASHE|nr:Hexosyltransferase [Fasciola hepatica]
MTLNIFLWCVLVPVLSSWITVAYGAVRSIDRKLTEWNALGSLSEVRSLAYLQNEYCLEDPQSPSSNITKTNSPTREPFYESEYLATPLHVNIYEQICLISSGQEPSATPVPMNEYNLVHSGAQICPTTIGSVDLLILVSSAVRNVPQRKLLRTAWSNDSQWLGACVRYAFLMDSLPLEFDEAASGLTLELSTYRDIVQIDLDGEPINETVRLIHGFRWSLAFCPQARWLLFVRDDNTVIPYNLIRFLFSISEAMRQRLIAGAVWDDPIKSAVNSFLYPGRNVMAPSKTDRYLTFVATSPMLVSTVLSPAIYLAMRFTEFIDQPELFFAAVMHKLFIIPAQVEQFYAFDRKPATDHERNLAIAYSD